MHEKFGVILSPLSCPKLLYQQFKVNRQTLADSVRSFRSTVTKVAVKFFSFAFDNSDFK